MLDKSVQRRDFLKTLLAGIPMLALDWDSFPKGKNIAVSETEFDAVIIGAGLGGLSCAAAFARQGFKSLVLEQHSVPGGYASAFKRPGGFVFDVSLHSTTVGERNGIYNLIPGFPEIEDVEFVPHPSLYRAIFPDYDYRVPQRNLKKYIETLIAYFPEEKQGIEGIFADMSGLARDINKYQQAGGQIDMSTFPKDFPYLFKTFNITWGALVDTRIKNPKLKAIVSSLWGYYGLPPSKLSCFYYALPTIGYLQEGGYYPKGRSQKMSDAFVKFIEDHGGTVKLKTRVEKILTKDHAAYGVKVEDGTEYKGKVIVSNANAFDTFLKMMDEKDHLKGYLARFDTYSVSVSCFQVFLGLKKDLVREVGIEDSEIFYAPGYSDDAAYKAFLEADVENSGYGLMLYDNVYKGYSPEGKNTVNILLLQGYDHWEKYEADYRQGNKKEYRTEKERMADILIKKVEETILPGLSEAIEVKEIGTPLTNWRYTRNYRGAIYGWDQTMNNTGPNRVPHATPIENLYLAGAWTKPGHGYSAVIPSGLECFAEIMKKW
ncbi:MAG: NAD(P)/FAD-dependent oxidoreductase [Candidatus Aminicenantes bacterium]|nr:NAD(P)/FAD-dependent oxidoreductase [Candidatus Aminicenantes bacterium]MDH5383400.1 NAD(P)/FAD-dependent oxidoreductase [Candidatus Aminicenantes bacterium]MDH5743897.1 NAD(P)/FAD-dependent oxidoreductase [Candidatus Aminicenantes bacterium]